MAGFHFIPKQAIRDRTNTGIKRKTRDGESRAFRRKNEMLTKTNYTAHLSESIEKTQRDRILALLIRAFRDKRQVSLLEILELKISQYGARIYQLRKQGWKIRNRQECIDGKRKSWFYLLSEMPSAAALRRKAIKSPERRRAMPNSIAVQQSLIDMPEQPARGWEDPEGMR